MIRPVLGIVLFFFVLFLPIHLQGQSNAPLGKRVGDNWLIGLSVGPTFFSGDLNPNRLLPSSGDLRMAGSLFAGRQMNPVFTLRGQFLFGKAAGTKNSTHFTATLLEGNVNTMINLSNLIGGQNPKRFFFVYGTVGIGGLGWKTSLTNTVTGLDIPNPASAWKVGAVFPVGLGGYFSIHNKVNLALEYTIRPTSSDLVDGTAGGFKLDIYSFLSLGITLNLNPGTRKIPDIVDIHKNQPIALNLPNCDKTKLPSTASGGIAMDKLPDPPVRVSPVSANYTYKVQIFAFSQRIYSPEAIRKKYHISQPVSREYSNGLYRFTVGSTKNLDQARELRNSMIAGGITDAFIVAYNDNGERMPFDQTMQND